MVEVTIKYWHLVIGTASMASYSRKAVNVIQCLCKGIVL